MFAFCFSFTNVQLRSWHEIELIREWVKEWCHVCCFENYSKCTELLKLALKEKLLQKYFARFRTQKIFYKTSWSIGVWLWVTQRNGANGQVGEVWVGECLKGRAKGRRDGQKRSEGRNFITALVIAHLEKVGKLEKSEKYLLAGDKFFFEFSNDRLFTFNF